jgi:hypothetical protein
MVTKIGEVRIIGGHKTVADQERGADNVDQQHHEKTAKRRRSRANRQALRRQRIREEKRHAIVGFPEMSGRGLGSTSPKPKTAPETQKEHEGWRGDPYDSDLNRIGDIDLTPWSMDGSTDSEEDCFQLSRVEEKKTRDAETQWQLRDVEWDKWSMEAAMSDWEGFQMNVSGGQEEHRAE